MHQRAGFFSGVIKNNYSNRDHVDSHFSKRKRHHAKKVGLNHGSAVAELP